MKTKSLLVLMFFFISNINAQERMIQIETSYGNIKLKLYDATPLHKDNFVKLIEKGVYTDLLFHRVIKNFMIQGGDASTKNTQENKQSTVDLNYTVDAEINYPAYFHKKGVLAAARMGDEVNPTRASSPSQFYIVTGKVLSEAQLQQIEKQRFERLKQTIFSKLQAENRDIIKSLYTAGNKEDLATLRDQLQAKTEDEANLRKQETLFTDEQREAYKTIGGTPHLDGEYTVFGEVVEGMDVVDKIQSASTSVGDKPIEDIRMNISLLK